MLFFFSLSFFSIGFILFRGNEMIVKDEFMITWPIGNWGICSYLIMKIIGSILWTNGYLFG